MSHAAQCALCKYARWQGNKPVGCLRMEGTREALTSIALSAMLWQNAAHHPCPMRERLPVMPDAYFATDLP